VISARQMLETVSSEASIKEEDRATATATLGKNLVEIKSILYGSIDTTEIDEEKAQEISRYAQSEGLIVQLVGQLDSIPFEARKDTALIFNNLIRKDISSFANYVSLNLGVLETLIRGYSSVEAALSCGSMLRECIRHEALARFILYSPLLWAFFDTYVHLPNFEVAADAFNTLRELLTTPKHKAVSEGFMEDKCDELLEKYDILLQSDNYVTRRRSLKLLSELLLDRSHYSVMMKYISSKRNLKTIMNLLRHKSSQIQFETFHVFKIFVANPKKTADIESILCKNRVKLIAYLESFHTENDDPQFVDEKRLLIDTLQQLSDPVEEEEADSNSNGGAIDVTVNVSAQLEAVSVGDAKEARTATETAATESGAARDVEDTSCC